MFCNVLTACFMWCIEIKTKLNHPLGTSPRDLTLGTSPSGPHPRDLTPRGPHPRAVSGRAGASTTSSSRTGSTSTSSVTSSASVRCTRTSMGRGSSSSTRRATATSTTRSVCPSARLPANCLSAHLFVRARLSARLSAR